MLLLFTLHAHAEPWGPLQGDFGVPPRDDAPTDARLLYEANFEVDARVVTGPGAPFALTGTQVLSDERGEPLQALSPPSGGWEAGATYTIEVADDANAGDIGEPGVDVLEFSVGDEPAAAPPAVEVLSVEVGAWSEEEDFYPNGCCRRTRTVTIEVASASDDPWAFVELVALTDDGEARVDVGIGPGTHTLTWLQWDEGGPQPPAFEVAQVSASGERGAAGRIEPGASDDAESAWSCGTSGAVAFAPIGLALLLVRRRVR